MSTDEVNQEAMQQQIEHDYRMFAAHLPAELQTKLETLLTTPESKSVLFEGLVFAIQFGRKLQQHDGHSRQIVVFGDGKQPSELFMKLMSNMQKS